MTANHHAITIVRSTNASTADLYAAWSVQAVTERSVAADVRIAGRSWQELAGGASQPLIYPCRYPILEHGRRIVQTLRLRSNPPGPAGHEVGDVTLCPVGPART